MSIDLRYIDTGHHLRYLVTMRAVYVRRVSTAESLGWQSDTSSNERKRQYLLLVATLGVSRS